MLYKFLLSASLMASAYSKACCIVHEDDTACSAEEGNACVWLDENDPLFTSGTSLGVQCVSSGFVSCNTGGFCPVPHPKLSDECVLAACDNDEYTVNAGIVIDESGSVGSQNYKVSLDFVKRMVRDDINDNSPVSILAFASRNDRLVHFNTDKEATLAAIQRERDDFNSGGTCTATALDEMISEYSSFASPHENNILFLMTDGQPNCGGEVCDRKAALDAAGIEVYVVGISSGFSASRVRCLVNDEKNILSIPQFKPNLFYTLESKLRNTVCPSVSWMEGEEEEQLVVSGTLSTTTGYSHNQFMLFAALISFALIGLAYFLKQKLCAKNKKYQPLVMDKIDPTTYNSV